MKILKSLIVLSLILISSIVSAQPSEIEMADAMMSTELVAGNYDVTASVMVKFRIV